MIRMIGLLFCAASALSIGACSDDDTNNTTADANNNTGGACESYCSEAMTNCTGANAVYADNAECMSACAAMPAGTEGDTDGNSASCRAYHAGVAGTMDAAVHCPHASASGGAVCGTKCEAYCSQIQTNCTGDNATHDDNAACLSACAAMPEGAFDDKAGNTVECRTYHASFPAAGMPAAHCGHASTTSDGDVCGGVCDAYCDQAMANCTAGNELYADRGTCMTACAAFPSGAFNDRGGDTAQCRTYHASSPAAGAPDPHCTHASADGNGVCVAP